MTQRMIAACVAVPLLLGLIAVAVFVPVPFASYHPGPTFDVLGESDGEEIIQVSGAKTYRDDGEIRMTTVSVSQEGVEKNIFEVMGDWIDPDSAVYPYDIVHPPGKTAEQEEVEGQVQMVSSQDNAIAAALRELDYEVTPALEVLSITPGIARRRRAGGARHLRLGQRRADHPGRGGPEGAARRDPGHQARPRSSSSWCSATARR